MEKPTFPEFHLFPRIERVAKFIGSIVRNTNVQFPTMLPGETDLKTSNHIRREWQPELEFES